MNMIEDTAGVGNHRIETSAAGVYIVGTFLILFLSGFASTCIQVGVYALCVV